MINIVLKKILYIFKVDILRGMYFWSDYKDGLSGKTWKAAEKIKSFVRMILIK